MIILASVLLGLAVIPCLMFCVNLRLYRKPIFHPADTPVSVLIPARNEERSIRAAVESALASEGVKLEVIVLDDHSEDDTASIVEHIIMRDDRVRLVQAPPLPSGWCGKQHACATLAKEANYDLLLFLDADVRLTPKGIGQMVHFMSESNAGLVSGVPHQETGSLLEKLIIPLIHFILLGFLPFKRMRQSTHPSYAAGCGQLFLARRDAYEKAGGHGAIRASLHDGITLPRAFRKAEILTDLFDATDTAICRMYQSAGELWQGLTKNTTEGLGNPTMILPMTLLLFGGQVLPFFLLVYVLLQFSVYGWIAVLLFGLAVLFAWLPRVLGMIRFHQSYIGARLHPFGVLLLIVIQWHGLFRTLFGRPASWKGREYSKATGSEINDEQSSNVGQS